MSDDLSSASPFSKFGQELGFVLEHFGEGEARIKVIVAEEHLNKGGTAFGGLHSSMLDAAMGAALVSTLKVEEWTATVNLTINYLEPSLTGAELTASGRITRRGRTAAHLAGEIVDQHGKLHATATGSWVIWRRKPDKLPGRRV